jgi:hypothetical protein
MSFRRAVVAAILIGVVAPLSASAAGPAAVRQVPITAPEGQLATLVSPTPVIRTDAATTRTIVRIDNPSHVVERVTVEARDYVLDASGTAQPAPAGYALGSAAWYSFDAATFELAPGTSRDVQVTVAPPATAAAGDHSASLDVTVRAAAPLAATGAQGTSVDTVLLVRNRLDHRVPGARPEMPDLRLDADVDGSTVHFAAAVTNPGNTVLSYQATGTLPTIQLYDTAPWADASHVALTLDPRGFYVPPQSERLASFDWVDGPIIGSYRAVYTLPAVDGLAAVSAETAFTVVNVPLLAALAVGVLAVLALLGTVLVRRRRRPVTAVRG